MLVASAIALSAAPAAVHAQSASGDEPRSATTTVFARYASRILKIQTVEIGSAAKVSTGTGFFVTADGRMMTNYHVISEWIHEPANHRIEVLDTDGTPTVAKVLAIDVVSDLAILEIGRRTPEHFTLSNVALLQGERLYSLGHPGDLGLSIVEGTYNGFLQHTLYTKIHFTGSINPGMSGGPTITERGRVVGVNVSTMGNQRSFLVPQERAAAERGRDLAPPRGVTRHRRRDAAFHEPVRERLRQRQHARRLRGARLALALHDAQRAHRGRHAPRRVLPAATQKATWAL